MFQFNNINIKYYIPDYDVLEFVDYIDKLKIKNEFNFELDIAIDYSLEPLGEYDLINHIIYINPSKCIQEEESAKYYINDYSMFGVLIHEFSHFLSLTYFKNFINDYTNQFPHVDDRAILNEYGNTDIREEVAELISSYIVNPYFIKMLSIKHYKFLKSYFKSPVPCSEKKFISIYKTFDYSIKKLIKNKYRIDYNIENNKLDIIN